MKRNPYVVGLASAAGVLLVFAIMIDIVIAEITDYLDYDRANVAYLQGWIFLLVGLAGVMLTGVAVIAGVNWAIRHRHDAPAPANTSATDDEATASAHLTA